MNLVSLATFFWWFQQFDKHSEALKAIGALLAGIAALVAIIVTLKSSSRQLRETIRTAEKQLTTNVDIAEKNLRATVRSNNRQKWIDELRTEIAHFLSLLPAASGLKISGLTVDTAKLIQEVNFRAAKINLLINPEKEDYRRLGELVDEALQHAQKSYEKGSRDSNQLFTDMLALTKASQKIFRTQWQRVKNLE